jgi:hypothetical protein
MIGIMATQFSFTVIALAATKKLWDAIVEYIEQLNMMGKEDKLYTITELIVQACYSSL